MVVAPGQLSVPTGTEKFIFALQLFNVLNADTFAGHIITGTWLSVTETVNEQVEVFEDKSVTLYTFVDIPTG